MSVLKRKPLFTVEQYLKLERASEDRYEFMDGQIYAMAGESDEHGDISLNLAGIFYNQLKDTPCRARTKDTKVRSGPEPKSKYDTKGLYSYPDLVVVCGEREFQDEHKDVLLNPTLIAEVLSPATEAFDRGEKCIRYQMWNSTLTDYLLISQDKPLIEHHIRQQDGGWMVYKHFGLEAVVPIASINCTLKLADVYDRIIFPKE